MKLIAHVKTTASSPSVSNHAYPKLILRVMTLFVTNGSLATNAIVTTRIATHDHGVSNHFNSSGCST